jgi:hypothetical protein
MKRPWWSTSAVMVVLFAIFALMGTAAAGERSLPAASDPNATSIWRVASSPNVGTLTNGLAGVAALSQTDAWAVGSHELVLPGQAPINQTLIQHWNGSKWAVVPSANVGTGENDLVAVAAISSTDAWAVGTFFDYRALAWHTLIEHWNGRKWTLTPSPNPSTRYNALEGVAAAGPNDVWAVGIEQISGPAIANRTLIQHWDGTAWSVVPSPNATSGNNYLLSVAVASPTDVWAVGSHDALTLTEHWDGTKWAIVASPNPGNQANFFNSVAVVSGQDVWAVGAVYPGGGGAERTLTEHWNGRRWTIVASPNVGTGNNALQAVAALSSSGVWSAGVLYSGSSQTLTEHWDGKAWTVVPSPSPGTEARLSGLAALAGGTLWSVGAFEQSVERTLILHTHRG